MLYHPTAPYETGRTHNVLKVKVWRKEGERKEEGGRRKEEGGRRERW
jgi:hypothetical protein